MASLNGLRKALEAATALQIKLAAEVASLRQALDAYRDTPKTNGKIDELEAALGAMAFEAERCDQEALAQERRSRTELETAQGRLAAVIQLCESVASAPNLGAFAWLVKQRASGAE